MSKFKVGDRVRENKNADGENLLEHWKSYWEGREGPSDGTFIITKDEGFGWFSYSNKKNGEGPQVHEKYFDIVEEVPEYSCIRVVPPSKPKREIITGEVLLTDCSSLKISNVCRGGVKIDATDYWLTPNALREAAALFTTLAEVLEENSNA